MFKKFLAVAIVGIGLQGSLMQAQSETKSLVALRVPSGTSLMLELDSSVNTATTVEGDTVVFRVRSDVKAADAIAIPKGTPVRAKVSFVKPAMVNAKKQHPEIRIRLDELVFVDRQNLPVRADVLKVKEEGRQRSGTGIAQSAIGNALPGMALGALLGGSRRSSGIGAVITMGVGILDSVTTSRPLGADIDLAVGSVFQTRLKQDLEIPPPSVLALPTAPSGPQPVIHPATSANVRPPIDDPISATSRRRAPELADLRSADESAPVSAPNNTTNADSKEAAGSFKIAVNVNLVLVDVIARDRAGRPFTNLRKEDFRIFEDGTERQIQSFSRDELPLAVALVIDRSGSVAPLMSSIQNAAFQALSQLKRGDEVSLFSFANTVERLEDLTTDRQRVANRIGDIQAGGGTTIVDAVNDAVRYLDRAAPDKRRAVILISDNIEGHSRTDANSVARSALESQAVIYSVKITASARLSLLPGLPGISLSRVPAGNPPSDPVSILTKETGGEVFEATGSDLDGVLSMTVARLKLRYTLGYDPVQTSSGAYHQIETRLVDRFGALGTDYTINSRTGYYDSEVRSKF